LEIRESKGKLRDMTNAHRTAATLSPLYSVPEAAPYLGMKPKGLWGLVFRGEIETVRVGRLRRISEKALKEFIDRNTIPPSSDGQ
jgi:excisionase family DNA binding protein